GAGVRLAAMAPAQRPDLGCPVQRPRAVPRFDLGSRGGALTTGEPVLTAPLSGSTVIITGASRGIGRYTAIHLASLGARLILVGRSPERHRVVQADLDKAGASHE